MTGASARRVAFDPVERETWEERVRRESAGDASSLGASLLGGVAVEPLYTAARHDAGVPGAPPFVRGGASTSEHAIVHALTGDDPEAIQRSARDAQRGDAARCWLPRAALSKLPDEAALLRALDGLDRPLDVEIDPLGLAWVGAFRRRGGVGVACDPFAGVDQGRLAVPLEVGVRAAAELMAAARAEERPVLIDGRITHEAGGHVPMELGAALGAGVDLLRRVSAHGHPLADAPRRMRFALSVGSDLFIEIAKLRAARWLWSKALRAMGVDGAEQGMRVHAFASRRERSSLGHHANLLRESAAGLAAMAGGADRITLEPYEASAHGERLSRNTMLLLEHESHLGRAQDPAGGSYAVEALTEQLARAGWRWFQRVEAEGGMGAALVGGWWAARVAEAAEERRAGLARGRVARVGVNLYPAAVSGPIAAESGPPPEDTAPEDARAPKAVRDALRADARGWIAALAASEAPVSALRAELSRLGDPVETAPLEPIRDAAPFESLRARGEAASAQPTLVGVGAPVELRDALTRASDALALAGLTPTRHTAASVDDLPDDALRGVVVAVGGSAALQDALVEAARGRGASAFAGPEPDDDRLALASAVLDALEASA